MTVSYLANKNSKVDEILKCKRTFRGWRFGGVIIVVFASLGLMAQQNQSSGAKRPKIGLALSGGGARGVAHVGVLRALEKHNIPIDYISGTSIGSIVGGLYAMGYKPDAMETFFQHLDWDALLTDDLPRKHLLYRRKQEDSQLSIDLEFGIKNGKLLLPNSLSTGNQLKLLMRMLCLEHDHAGLMEQMPIPFSAVATSMEDGGVAVLDQGDIVDAIRSSMALPGIFAPVELNGQFLSDGGMVRNLPVDIVRKMGADIVIAVDISKPLLKGEELTSLVQVSNQALGILTALNVQKSLKEADIVLSPAVGDIDLLDFSKILPLVELGEIAVAEKLNELEPYMAADEAATKNEKTIDLFNQDFKLGFISFSGLSKIDPRRVLQRIALKENALVGYEDFQRAMYQLAGMEEFDFLDFQFQKEADLLHLLISVREKPNGPNYLKFGFQLFSTEAGGLELNLLVNHSIHPLNRRGGEWRNQLNLGQNFGLNSEYFQPIDVGENLFAAVDLKLQKDSFNIFRAEDRIGEGESFIGRVGAAVGVQLQNWGEMRLGVVRGFLETSLRTGDLATIQQLFPEEVNLGEDVDFGGYFSSFNVDLLDDPFIPQQGYVLDINGFHSRRDLEGALNYDRVELRYLQFAKKGQNVFLAGVDLGTAFGGTLPLFDQFSGGGIRDFSGLASGQISGSYKGVLRLGYFWDLKSKKSRSEIGGWFDIGNYWRRSEDITLSDPLLSASIFYSRETPIGPIYLGTGITDGGFGQLFLAFGQIF